MELIQRGDVVICALQGDFGKPRPAVIVQSDLFNPTHPSLTLCPITSHLVEAPLFRVNIPASKENGLNCVSQVMIDKLTTLRREKVKQRLGTLTIEQLSTINSALKTWLNLNMFLE